MDKVEKRPGKNEEIKETTNTGRLAMRTMIATLVIGLVLAILHQPVSTSRSALDIAPVDVPHIIVR